MSLNYPLDFPNVGFTRFDLRFRKAVAMTESPFSYAQQIHDFGGGRWEAEVSLEPLTISQAKGVEAFLIGLEGKKGTFQMGHPLQTLDITQSASANTKGATTVTMIASGNNLISAGNYFSASYDGKTHLHMMTSAKTIQGTQIIEIQPPYRFTTSSIHVLDFTYPQGLWRMATNDVNIYTDINGYKHISFACIEAI